MHNKQSLSLDQLWHEAEEQEYDLSIQDDGTLRLQKRGHQTPLYISLQPVNQVVLQDAWNWLLQRRAVLDQIDQVRNDNVPHRKHFSLIWWLRRLYVDVKSTLQN